MSVFLWSRYLNVLPGQLHSSLKFQVLSAIACCQRVFRLQQSDISLIIKHIQASIQWCLVFCL